MKGRIQELNAAAKKYLSARKSTEAIISDIERTEGDLRRIENNLKELRRDREYLESVLATRLEEHAILLRQVKSDFAAQERFKDAPSEKINQAFSDEILPDLDDID